MTVVSSDQIIELVLKFVVFSYLSVVCVCLRVCFFMLTEIVLSRTKRPPPTTPMCAQPLKF